MPDLSDIAAIFTLVGNIFEGRFISKSVSPNSDGQPTPAPEDDDGIHVAIWPPQPVHQDLQSRIGTTGLGQLHWCQRILQTFLKPDTAVAQQGNQRLDEAADDNTDAETEKTEAVKAEERKQLQRVADRIWDKAAKDYERLTNRLRTLEPDEKMAERLWIGAIAVFLATMAVRRAACRLASVIGDIPSAAYLASNFLRLMVDERKQHPDFCCSRDMRYRNETFPPLSADLRRTFDTVIHPDLSAVMLAVVAQKKMREAPNNEYPLLWPRLLGEILETDFELSPETAETCHRIWRQYLRDETSHDSDEDFLAALKALMSMRAVP
jgi:hypothetical protein